MVAKCLDQCNIDLVTSNTIGRDTRAHQRIRGEITQVGSVAHLVAGKLPNSTE
jgi:hypothetical protein